MRIIAGRLKGRRLTPPSWPGLRPTSDRLRETLFNVLNPRMVGARVLDGFAGTGAVGIEAISRGAAHVVFVDADARSATLIARNLGACGVAGGYTIRRGDVSSVLRRHEMSEPFDVMFLDPPYDASTAFAALSACVPLLRPDGVLVLEHATRRQPEAPGSLRRVRDVRSGDSTLTFFVPLEGPRDPAEHR